MDKFTIKDGKTYVGFVVPEKQKLAITERTLFIQCENCCTGNQFLPEDNEYQCWNCGKVNDCSEERIGQKTRVPPNEADKE